MSLSQNGNQSKQMVIKARLSTMWTLLDICDQSRTLIIKEKYFLKKNAPTQVNTVKEAEIILYSDQYDEGVS